MREKICRAFFAGAVALGRAAADDSAGGAAGAGYRRADAGLRPGHHAADGEIGNGTHGYSFCSPRRGVRAHIQHLIAYAKKEAPCLTLADPRYTILVERYPQYHGAIRYRVGLNGRWAVPGTTYGQDILRLWHEALKY